MRTFLITIILMTAYAGCFGQKADKTVRGWTSVYSNDENGKGTSGEIETLMEGLRKGYSLKVGWSWTRQLGDSTVTLEHFAEPVFVTIIQKKNVSAIINPHPLLKSYLDISKQEFDNPNNIWQCILTTQGTFNAMVYSQAGETIRNMPQRHKMIWYLQYP